MEHIDIQFSDFGDYFLANTRRTALSDSWNMAFGRYKNDSNISGNIRKLAAAICETVIIGCADRIVIVTKTAKYYIFRLFRLFRCSVRTDQISFRIHIYIYVFPLSVCVLSVIFPLRRFGVGDLIKIAVEFNESHHRPTELKCVLYAFPTHTTAHGQILGEAISWESYWNIFAFTAKCEHLMLGQIKFNATTTCATYFYIRERSSRSPALFLFSCAGTCAWCTSNDENCNQTNERTYLWIPFAICGARYTRIHTTHGMHSITEISM